MIYDRYTLKETGCCCLPWKGSCVKKTVYIDSILNNDRYIFKICHELIDRTYHDAITKSEHGFIDIFRDVYMEIIKEYLNDKEVKYLKGWCDYRDTKENLNDLFSRKGHFEYSQSPKSYAQLSVYDWLSGIEEGLKFSNDVNFSMFQCIKDYVSSLENNYKKYKTKYLSLQRAANRMVKNPRIYCTDKFYEQINEVLQILLELKIKEKK